MYVGASDRVEQRIREHRWSGAEWVDQLHRLTVVEYPDRKAAEHAESQAIATERPLYNITGTVPLRPKRATARPSTVVSDDPLLDLDWLCAYLRVDKKSVYTLRYRNEGPPAYRIGRHLRYRKSEVDQWLDGQR